MPPASKNLHMSGRTCCPCEVTYPDKNPRLVSRLAAFLKDALSRGARMIAHLSDHKIYLFSRFNISEMRNESDVEQKLVYPFLTNVSYLGLPPTWGSK